MEKTMSDLQKKVCEVVENLNAAVLKEMGRSPFSVHIYSDDVVVKLFGVSVWDKDEHKGDVSKVREEIVSCFKDFFTELAIVMKTVTPGADGKNIKQINIIIDKIDSRKEQEDN
jgi:hypothetical protein